MGWAQGYMVKPLKGERVQIYRNLNTGTLSMRAKTSKGWRVVGHPKSVEIGSAVFVVRKAGRERVIREQRKNVHAWIEGELLGEDPEGQLEYRAKYNPYENAYWVGDGKRVAVANRVIVRSDGMVTYSGGSSGI